MLKNNCQCELCRSVWGVGEREGESVTVEGGRPIAKRAPVVGSGLATQVITLGLLVCGDLFIVGMIPDGMWYTAPSGVLAAVVFAFPVAHAGFAVLDSLKVLYENN